MPSTRPLATHRTLFRAALGAALGIAAAGWASGCNGSMNAEVRKTVTLSASGGGSSFVLENRVGDVRITADPAATSITAEVTSIGRSATAEGAQKALDEIIITMDAQPDASGVVRARAEHPSGAGGRGYSVQWVVTVPAGLAAEVRSGVSDVRIDGLAGAVKVTLGVGDITIGDSAGAVAASTGTGDVRITGAGEIRAESKVGDVDVVQRGSSADAIATTGVGDVTVRLVTSWRGRITAGTSVGDVDVSLAGNVLKAERVSGKSFTGVAGEETGAQVTATSNVGDVSVRGAGGAGS